MTNKESHLRNNKDLCFLEIDSKSIVGSHLRSNRESVESSSTMTIVKQTRTRQTSSKENLSDRNGSQKTKDEFIGKTERFCSKFLTGQQKVRATKGNLSRPSFQTSVQTMESCNTKLSNVKHMKSQI